MSPLTPSLSDWIGGLLLVLEIVTAGAILAG